MTLGQLTGVLKVIEFKSEFVFKNLSSDLISGTMTLLSKGQIRLLWLGTYTLKFESEFMLKIGTDPRYWFNL